MVSYVNYVRNKNGIQQSSFRHCFCRETSQMGAPVLSVAVAISRCTTPNDLKNPGISSLSIQYWLPSGLQAPVRWGQHISETRCAGRTFCVKFYLTIREVVCQGPMISVIVPTLAPDFTSPHLRMRFTTALPVVATEGEHVLSEKYFF